MVSMDKIQRGASRFIDMELMPKLVGKDRWIVAGILSLYIAKLPVLAEKIKGNEAVKILGLFAEDGSVDLETVVNSIKPAARQTSASFNIPMGGTITLSESDIDTLYNYIMQA